MKTIIKQTLVILFFGIIVSTADIFAQGETTTATTPGEKNKALTAEQLAILKANRAKKDEFRKAFKESLSENQLATLTNPKINRADRMKSFRASLSDNQVSMLKDNVKNIKAQHNAFRSTLTDQQKMKLRRMAVNRSQNNRMMYMRARMRYRQQKI